MNVCCLQFNLPDYFRRKFPKENFKKTAALYSQNMKAFTNCSFIRLQSSIFDVVFLLYFISTCVNFYTPYLGTRGTFTKTLQFRISVSQTFYSAHLYQALFLSPDLPARTSSPFTGMYLMFSIFVVKKMRILELFMSLKEVAR